MVKYCTGFEEIKKKGKAADVSHCAVPQLCHKDITVLKAVNKAWLYMQAHRSSGCAP